MDVSCQIIHFDFDVQAINGVDYLDQEDPNWASQASE
jgi:hypothetical protein